MTHVRHKLAVTWGSALLLLVLATALVQPASGATANANAPRQAVVNYSDLNLASPQGAAKLYARIRQAAKSVCGTPGSFYLRLRQLQQECIDQAIDAAVREVDHPGLTAHHRSNGRLPRVAQNRAF
ncbi:MAG TPA: UrcA family protein [Steroidobacteraceae bacterium]